MFEKKVNLWAFLYQKVVLNVIIEKPVCRLYYHIQVKKNWGRCTKLLVERYGNVDRKAKVLYVS